MEKRFWPAIGAFSVLAIFAVSTLTGPIRTATLLFLGALAFKTWIALLRHRQEQRDRAADGERGDAGGSGERSGKP